MTLNINLGLTFEGGELLFHGKRRREGEPDTGGAAARPFWFEWDEVGSGVWHLASILWAEKCCNYTYYGSTY